MTEREEPLPPGAIPIETPEHETPRNIADNLIDSDIVSEYFVRVVVAEDPHVITEDAHLNDLRRRDLMHGISERIYANLFFVKTAQEENNIGAPFQMGLLYSTALICQHLGPQYEKQRDLSLELINELDVEFHDPDLALEPGQDVTVDTLDQKLSSIKANNHYRSISPRTMSLETHVPAELLTTDEMLRDVRPSRPRRPKP